MRYSTTPHRCALGGGDWLEASKCRGHSSLDYCTGTLRLYSQAGAEFDGMDCTPVSNAVHCPVAPVTELIDVKMSIYC